MWYLFPVRLFKWIILVLCPVYIQLVYNFRRKCNIRDVVPVPCQAVQANYHCLMSCVHTISKQLQKEV